MRTARHIALFLAFLISVPAVIYGQPSESPDNVKAYDLSLNILVGSSAPSGQGRLSADLRSALEELPADNNYASYSPVASLHGPLAVGGQAQWKLITEKLGSFGTDNMPIVSEWSLGPLETVPGNASVVDFRRFAFQARVPLKFGEAVNYEGLQATLNRVRVPVGKATVIGNLPVPETGEMLFFVVRVKETR